MRKSTIPVVAVLAVAPATMSAVNLTNSAAAEKFDAATLKANLYAVINTLGKQGSSDGYVQAVKDKYLVQTSALENEIAEFCTPFVDGEGTGDSGKTEEQILAAKKGFQDRIDKIAKDAADMQKPYQDAFDAAKNAVQGANESYNTVKDALGKLSVPSVREKWLKKLEDLNGLIPAEPDSAEDQDKNNDTEAKAYSAKKDINALVAQANQANADALTTQATILADLLTLQNDVKTAAENAGKEIATLTENTGIDASFTNKSNECKNAAADEGAWWKAVKKAEAEKTLDTQKEALEAQGNEIKTNIDNNLKAAKEASVEAEKAAYKAITDAISDYSKALEGITVDPKDTKSADYKSTAETAIEVASIAAKQFNGESTSFKNKSTNDKNVEAIGTAIENLKASVENYGYYTDVNKAIENVQKTYNEDITRLTEELAGKEVYQDVYEKVNKELNILATLIKSTKDANEALYEKGIESTKEEYQKLIDELTGSTTVGTRKVDDALALYKDQETAKTAADDAVAKLKDGIEDADVLEAISNIETIINDEYKKHDLTADDYNTLIGNVKNYKDQIGLYNSIEKITADSEVFVTAIADIEADKKDVKEKIAFENGQTVTPAEDINSAITKINDKINKLNAEAAAELESYNGYLVNDDSTVKSLNKKLSDAETKIKAEWTPVYNEYKTKIEELQTRINAIEADVKEAYSDAKEEAADPKYNAVRNLTVDTTIATDIDKLVAEAETAYGNAVDNANEAAYNQLTVDLSEIQAKLEDAAKELGSYKAKVDGVEGPDYNEVVEKLQAEIVAQQKIVEEARTAQLKDKANDNHIPTIVSLLEQVDKVLYGETYPATSEKDTKDNGVWDGINTELANALANYNAYEAEIKAINSVDEAVKAFLTNLETLKDLTAEEIDTYKAEAARVSQYNNNGFDVKPTDEPNPEKGGMRLQANSLFKEKSAATILETIKEYSEHMQKYLNEEDVNEDFSQIEYAKNDNKYHQIVKTIDKQKEAYDKDIADAKLVWATQYSELSGVYADATGYEEYKDELDKALAAYQKELTEDIAKLNKAKEAVKKAYDEAMEDANKHHEEIVSLTQPCTADTDFIENAPKATIDEVAKHIASTTERAEDNLTAFKKQIDDIRDLKDLVEKGKKEIEEAREKMANQAETGTSSEALDAADAAIEQAVKDIEAHETNVCDNHRGMSAVDNITTAADKVAEITANLEAARNGGVPAFNEEIKAYNEKVLSFEAEYIGSVKDIYDEYLKKIGAYGSYQHNQYRKFVEDTQETFFGLAEKLRVIEKELNSAAAEATKNGDFFDKELAYKKNADEVKNSIIDEYNSFLEKTNEVALGYWKTEDVKKQLDAAKAAVADYGYMHKPNLDDEPVAKPESKIKADAAAFEALVEKANADIEKKILAQNLDSYLEQLNAINVAADWNDDAKAEFDYQIPYVKAIIAEANDFKYSDGNAYGEGAQDIIEEAIDAAQKLVDKAVEDANESYADETLPADIEDILGTLAGIADDLEAARESADEKQSEINNDAANKAILDEVVEKYNDLAGKYNSAVETVNTKYPNANVKNTLNNLGGTDNNVVMYGEKFDRRGSIEILIARINTCYTNGDWENSFYNKERIESMIKSYSEQIDKLLEDAKAQQNEADANSDYHKVGVLLSSAQKLVEPYNRAEVNKDNTPEDIAEASDIFKELSGLLAKFKGAQNAYDEAKLTVEDPSDDKLANEELADIVAKTSDYEAQIKNLADRITKLDKELSAYNEMNNAIAQIAADLKTAEEEVAGYEYASEIDFTNSAEYKAAVEAIENAQTELDKSHALFRANADKTTTSALIADAKAKVEAAKQAAEKKNSDLTSGAKSELLSGATKSVMKSVADALENVAALREKTDADCPQVAADFIDEWKDVEKAIKKVRNYQQDVLALDAENMTVAELEEAVSGIKANAEASVNAALADAAVVSKAEMSAQKECAKDNAVAYSECQDEVQAVQGLLDELAGVVDGYRNNEDEVAELEGFQTELDDIAKAIEESNEGMSMVDDKDGHIAALNNLKERIEAAAESWADANRYGDINSDKIVDIDDVQACINIILDQRPEGVEYNEEAADVNGNGSVTVADLVLINGEYLEPGYIANYINEMNGSHKMAKVGKVAPGFADADIAVAYSGNTTMMATEAAYSAIQMDITMSSSSALSDVNVPGATVAYSKIGDATYRVVAYASNDVINSITVTTNGNVIVENVIAATANGGELALNAVASDPTAIKDILSSESFTIFGEDGIVRQTLSKGMNILKNAAGAVKKVFVK